MLYEVITKLRWFNASKLRWFNASGSRRRIALIPHPGARESFGLPFFALFLLIYLGREGVEKGVGSRIVRGVITSYSIHYTKLYEEIILVGTAHVSRESIDEAVLAIREEKPDMVCVEPDEGRLQSLTNEKGWQELV